MRPTKCPDIPVSLERNTEVFPHHFLGALSPLLIWTGGLTPLLCLEGVPDLPVAPQDEAGLTKTFQTWPRGWFHIPAPRTWTRRSGARRRPGTTARERRWWSCRTTRRSRARAGS